MAVNSLAPAFVRIFYTSASTPHVQTLQIQPDGPLLVGIEPTFATKGGTGLNAGIAVNAYLNIIKAQFKTTDVFTGYEVYSQPTPTSDPLFIWADDLIIAGTLTGASIQNSQAVFTYGTVAGGLLKLYFMEGVFAIDQRVANRSSAPGIVGTITTYILGATNWIKGRDDAFPARGIFYTTKINDTLRKKQLLDQ